VKSRLNLETVNAIIEATYPDMVLAFYVQVSIMTSDDLVGIANMVTSIIAGVAYIAVSIVYFLVIYVRYHKRRGINKNSAELGLKTDE
jgi:hypothetical protein